MICPWLTAEKNDSDNFQHSTAPLGAISAAPHLLWPRLEWVVLGGRLKHVHVSIHRRDQEIHAAVAVQVISQHHAATHPVSVLMYSLS